MRRDDWLTQLWNVIETAERVPVIYGPLGCVRLVAQCLDAMLIESAWVAHVEPLCANHGTALRLLMRSGGLETLVSAQLGASVPRNLARRGDVASVDLDTGPSIGICIGERVVISAIPSGVDYRPLSDVRCAWRVE
jgi:hypothetical protein